MRLAETGPWLRLGKLDCRFFDSATRDETASGSAQDDGFYIYQELTPGTTGQYSWVS
jgi:hypothetical protein